MKSSLLSILIVFLCAVGCAAGPQVNIEQSSHVYNKSGYNCVWCCIDTLARHNNIEKLIGISDKYAGPVYISEAIGILERKGSIVKVSLWDKSEEAIEEFLTKPCEEGLGVTVSIDVQHPNHAHMVVVVHYDPEQKDVRIVDNNYKEFKIIKMDWEDFHSIWTGSAMYLKKG